LRVVEKDLDWEVRDAAATEQALENALRFKDPDLANVHGVEIMRQAYRFARHEHGEKLPAEARGALERLGRFCELNEGETRLVCERFAEELAQTPGEEK